MSNSSEYLMFSAVSGVFNKTYQPALVTRGLNCTIALNLDSYDEALLVPNVTGQTESWHDNPGFIPTTIIYAFTFLLGVIGNGLVIFALLGDRKAHNVTSMFLISLAVADLLFLLVCVPYETVDLLIIHVWPIGNIFCKLARFVEMLSASASVLNLIAVGIERYIVIVHPMRARSYCTMGRSRKYIAGVWIAAFVLSLPTLVIMTTWKFIFYDTKCLYADTMECLDQNLFSDSDKILFAWYQMIVMYILPVIIMATSYSVVIYTLWISNKELAKMTKVTKGISQGAALPAERERRYLFVGDPHSMARGGSNPSRHRTTKDHSVVVIKMLLVILGIFLCCWGPRLVLNILRKTRPRKLDLTSIKAFYTMQFIHLLPYIQSCVNPLIYTYMSKNFRGNMRKSFQDRCHCDPGRCYYRRRSNITFSPDVTPGAPNGTVISIIKETKVGPHALL